MSRLTSVTLQEAWFEVPTCLENDRTVMYFIEQRKRAYQSMIDADDALRCYVQQSIDSEEAGLLLDNLTPLQAKALEYICDHYKLHKMSPTANELSLHMEMPSINSAIVVIQSLEKKGYIRKTKGKWRSCVPMFNSKRVRIIIKEKNE